MKSLKYIIIFLLLSNFLYAQNGGVISFPDARTVAMGSQGAVTASGVYSVLLNPANLTLQTSNFELSTVFPLPSINVASGNDFMSFSDFNYYFGGVTNSNGNVVGRYLDQSEKAEILSKLNDGNLIQSSSAINIISFSFSAGKDIGSFGFSINDIIGQRTGLPKDLLDIFLNGNEIGRTYRLDDMVFTTSYLREYDLSYAKDFSFLLDEYLKSFSVGMTLKMVHGYAYSEIETLGTTITTNNDHSILIQNDFKANLAVSPDFGIKWDFDSRKKASNISPFLNPAGKGFGFNIGFAAEVDSVWSLGLSITDIGSVNWNNEPVSFKSNGSFLLADVTDSTMTDSLEAALEPTGSYSKNSFTSDLPTVLRIGASFRLDKFLGGNFPGEMLLVFGYNQGFNNSLNNTTKPLVGLGFEWKPISILPIRSGISFGGFKGLALSLGFGIDANIVEFNFASADILSVINGDDAKFVQFTMGSRWKF